MTFQDKKVIALVPARGGSKGVPRKNLRIVRGRPLVAHSIQAALDSGFVDQVVLTSDDPNILAVGRSMGADLHTRSASAASDQATANDVIRDFLACVDEETQAANPFLVFLQPTSPMRTGRDVDACFELLHARQADTCISVMEMLKTPFKSFTLDDAGKLQSLFEERVTNANRQALPKAYYPNGAIYIFPLRSFLDNGGFPSNGAIPYVMSPADSIDIDSEEDLRTVEKLCLEK